MAIKVVKEPDIHLTQGEIERLRPEYRRSQMYTTQPVSFETWLRSRNQTEEAVTVTIGGRPINTKTTR